MNSLKTEFLDKVRETVLKHKMLENTPVIYTALSGGADSVALHLALKELSAEYGFTLKAVHVHHMIRGSEADRDLLFCRKLCESLGTELADFRVPVPDYAREHHLSTEEAARVLRYKCFESLDEALPFKVATAHNLNDSAETVIFNLSRGTGLKGLTGIPVSRDMYIRPLSGCTRREIEDFLAEKGQDFVTDSTNLTDDYTRNRIRQHIIPQLEGLHGGFYGNLSRMLSSLSDDADFLEKTALESENARLSELHPSIRRRVIINLLRQHNIEVSAEKIISAEEAVLNPAGGKINLSGNVYAVAKDGYLRIMTILNERVIFPETLIEKEETPFLCDKKVIIQQNNSENHDKNGIVNKKFTENDFDCDKIQGRLFLRNRRNGDSYKRLGRNFTSSLKKLMNEKYPSHERDLIPVIADESGIIWVEGFGIADRVRTDASTKASAHISVVKKQEAVQISVQ